MSEEANVQSIASLGGKAAAENMTPAQRKERAKQAAAARWAGSVPQAKYGSPERPLRISDIEIPCYVLDDGRRVIIQGGVLKGLGMSQGTGRLGEGDRLAKFVTGKSLNPFISNDLLEMIKNPVRFRVPAGSLAYGYEATILADLCDAVLEARKQGHLHHQQAHIAAQCEILVRAFTRTGIIALIDEATGYQYDRLKDELQRILEKYVSKELARYARVFEPDFYKHIHRLKGWKYDPNGVKRSHAVARVTVDLTYDRIHPDLLKELKQARNEKGKSSQKLHQWLTTDAGGGHPRLKQHAEGVTALLSVARNWGQFQEWVDTRYPKLNQTIQLLPFPEPEDDEEDLPPLPPKG